MKSRMEELRVAIAAMQGKKWIVSELGLGGDKHIHNRISKLLDREEVEVVGVREGAGKPQREFKARNLKLNATKCFVRKNNREIDELNAQVESPWVAVWPEFFTEPNLIGKSRFVSQRW